MRITFKKIRKISFWFFGSIIGFLLLLITLGYIFEDKLHLLAIKELEKALNADIEVHKTEVSFIRSWPSVQVKLKDLHINPREHKSPEDVISARSLALNIGFWSIFTNNYKISQVRIVEPVFNLEVDKKGMLNFGDMFVVESDSTDEKNDSEEMVFELKAVEIEDGEFSYHDLRDGSKISIDSIQLEMDGDFSAERSDINTDFALHLNRWTSGRTEWARNKHLSAEILSDVQFGENENYALKSATLKVAALTVDVKGNIARKGSVFDLDLSYASNKSSFESFLSLLPGGLLDTGREYEYDGRFITNGWLRGKAGAGKSPDIHADFAVDEGAFHYVGYESRLSAVKLKGEFELLQSDPSASHLELKDFTAMLHGKAISGNMTYANFKDPRLAVALKGELSLRDVKDFYPAFADSTEMEGVIAIDAQIEGKIADFEEKRHGAIKAFGGASFESLKIQDPHLLMPIENLSGKILLDNQRIEVSRLTGKAGRSDFDLRGTVTEYLPYIFNENATIKGVIECKSSNLDLNEWLQADGIDKTNATTEKPVEEFAFKFPENIDFRIIAQFGKFKLDNFEATGMNGVCRFADQTITLEELQMNTLGGNASISGRLKVIDLQHCGVDILAKVNNVDINQTFRTFEQLAAFAMVKENLYGRFSGDVKIFGGVNQHLELDTKSFVSFGDIIIQDCKLINFEPLEGLAGFVKLEDLRHIEFSEINTSYRIENEFFFIPKMTVSANRYKLMIAGKHGFDNSLDYKVYVELPRKEAKRSTNKEVLDMIEVNQGDPLKVILPVHITGTVDHPKYRLEGQFVANKLEEQLKKQGEQLKEGWNKEIAQNFGEKDTNRVDDMIDVQRDPSDTAKIKVGNVINKVKKPFDKLKKPFKTVGDALR